MASYGMVFDLKRCIGCNACAVACKQENNLPNDVFFTKTLSEEVGEYPKVSRVYIPTLCNHCEDAPCVDVCPTGASFKSEDTGIVDIDHEKCVGCRACMMGCPYNNRYFNEERLDYFQDAGATPYEEARTMRHQDGVVMKCNFCRDRVRAGKEPACVANCPTVARHFGDLDDPISNVSRLIKERAGFALQPEKGTKPNVYYLPA